MDEKELQQRKLELEVREKELVNANISFHEKLDESVNKQESLRRAIEVGSNCYVKFNPKDDKDPKEDKVLEALRDLVFAAAIKLKDEIFK
jgi:hypothetical protein